MPVCCNLAVGGAASNFVPGACERLEPYLLSQVVGQDLAIRQLTDAVCDHLARENPTKPLVVSAHGPPGVGKSLTHLLAARALYNRRPHQAEQCPGRECPGYKVRTQRQHDCTTLQGRFSLRYMLATVTRLNAPRQLMHMTELLVQSCLSHSQLYCTVRCKYVDGPHARSLLSMAEPDCFSPCLYE